MNEAEKVVIDSEAEKLDEPVPICNDFMEYISIKKDELFEYRYLEQLEDDFGELHLHLSDKECGGEIIIRFYNVLSYTSTYETARSKMFYNNLNTIITMGVFSEVVNSPYAEWIALQSENIYLKSDLRHFCILTTEFVIDIICGSSCELPFTIEKIK